MSNSLDPDQARPFVGPDLGLKCLQRFQQTTKEGGIFRYFYFFCFFCYIISFIFLFLPCPSLLSPLQSLLSLFSLAMEDDTKWPTRINVSVNPDTVKEKHTFFIWRPLLPIAMFAIFAPTLFCWDNLSVYPNVCLMQGASNGYHQDKFFVEK